MDRQGAENTCTSGEINVCPDSSVVLDEETKIAIKRKYQDLFDQQLSDNVIECVNNDTLADISSPPDAKPTHFLPHRYILKKDQKSIRVVYDGSCRTKAGLTLNYTLY